MMGRSFR